MEKLFIKTISVIFTLAMLVIAVFTATRGWSNIIIYAFSIITFIIFYILIKKDIIRINKKTILIMLIISILLRIGIFLLDYNKPLMSDYQFFYENAKNFAEGKEINNRYVATFPYLAPYVVLLGTVFKIFNSSNYLLVILLHTILDLITSILIYKILDKEDKKMSMLGATLWLINPINIIWNTICCPVVVTNFGIACILYIFEKIRKNIDKKLSLKKFVVLNILYGSVIGVFNSFRPIMIILIIATIMYYIYDMLKNLSQKKRNIILVIGIILILTTYELINMISNTAISKLIKQEVATTPGWTLYLGSNLEYKGMWNEPAGREYGELLNNEEISAEELQQVFKEKAIQQYIDNGARNIKLFINKYKILTNNIVGYSYQTLNEVATINNNILKMIRVIAEIVMAVIILLNIYTYTYINGNVQMFKNMLLYILAIIGMLASHMLVEVSPRYVLPLMPMITIVATYTLYNILDKQKNKIRLLEAKK